MMAVRFVLSTLALVQVGHGQWASSANPIYPNSLTSNVGIGNNAPQYRLHVTAGDYKALRLSTTNTASDIRVEANPTTGGTFDFLSNGGLNGFVFHSGSTLTELLRLDHTGLATLNERAIISTATATESQEALMVNQRGTGMILNLRQNNQSKVVVDNAGNVGIGITAPGSKLEVNGNASLKGSLTLDGENGGIGSRYGGASNDFFRFYMDGQTTDNGILHIRTGDNSMEPIYFEQGVNADPGTSSNVRMAVASNGSIGIGTTSPSAYLHVSGAGVGSGMSGIDLTNIVAPGHTFKLSAGIKGYSEAGFTIMDRTAGDVSRIAIDNNGNVGIGEVNPDCNLTVANRAKITGATDGQEALIVNQAKGSGSIADFRQGGNSKLNIANNGDLTTAGTITAANIKTKVWSVAPDYVFEDDYKLASLEHVEKFVDKHKHLPDIPSAMEFKEKGVDLADMNMKLLRKVEELTLYSIKQQKDLQALRARLDRIEHNPRGSRSNSN